MLSAKLPLTIAVVASLGLAGCTNEDGTRNNTGTGVLAGAGAGALVGQLIGKDTKGTAIGAVAGAALGGAIGAQLDKQQKDLQRAIGGSGARIVNTGSQLIVSLPEAITFPVDSATVKPSLRDDIRAIGFNLQDYPNSSVRVIGHTDNTGSNAYNKDLSIRRATAVRDILLSSGVRGNRVRAVGRGENQPIATNATAAGRQANRRVEIVITPNT